MKLDACTEFWQVFLGGRPHEQVFPISFSLTRKNCPCGRVILVKFAWSNQPGWKLGCTVFQPATCSPSNENLLVWTASKEKLSKICARIQFSFSFFFLCTTNRGHFRRRHWRQMAARLSKEKSVARPHEPVSLSLWTSFPCHGKLARVDGALYDNSQYCSSLSRFKMSAADSQVTGRTVRRARREGRETNWVAISR